MKLFISDSVTMVLKTGENKHSFDLQFYLFGGAVSPMWAHWWEESYWEAERIIVKPKTELEQNKGARITYVRELIATKRVSLSQSGHDPENVLMENRVPLLMWEREGGPITLFVGDNSFTDKAIDFPSEIMVAQIALALAATEYK